jgi:hypothetical protein
LLFSSPPLYPCSIHPHAVSLSEPSQPQPHQSPPKDWPLCGSERRSHTSASGQTSQFVNN